MMGARWDTVGEDTANTTAVTVTGGAANTKGASWLEIVASTAFAASWVGVFAFGPSASADYLIDIAVGGAGSEVVLIANLQVSTKATESARFFLLPLKVPSDSRLSCKIQSTTASATLEIAIIYGAKGWLAGENCYRCTTYGANTADSGSTGLDPGGTAHTKGGWTQIVASTTNPIKAMLVILGDRNNNAMTTCNWLLDIGVGASTAEQVLFTLAFSGGLTNDEITPNVFGPFLLNLPAGVRLAGNLQCTIIDATDRLIDVELVCVG